MNVLIVRAHPEPKSFCSALANQASKTMSDYGHQVNIADLYTSKFDPVSDRRNFTSVKDGDYFKQQAEETFASETNGFAPELEVEIKMLEAADLLIFVFPLWWFGMPAVLKGWVDRVFASARIYGGEKLYENGLGKATKRALIVMTTGGGPDVYSGFGVNPTLNSILTPIQHGVFWFNGFLPLEPFIAWSPARMTSDVRRKTIEALANRLRLLSTETPQVFPPLSDFAGSGKDNKKRFMVTASMLHQPDSGYQKLVPQEMARIAELKKQGIILAHYIGNPAEPTWHAFLLVREASAEAVHLHVQSLPLARYLRFEIIELLQM